MQALWRGHAVRSEEEAQLMAELQELEFLAARHIQARVRGVTPRAELAQVFAQVEEDMRQVAAIHIQASIWAWGGLCIIHGYGRTQILRRLVEHPGY